MAFETIGDVRGHAVSWNRKTGEIYVKMFGVFSSSWQKLLFRAYNTTAVFDLVDDFLRRQ